MRVLRILKFTGELRDDLGRPRAGTIAVTFALYEQAEGSAPLWLETQNIQPDEHGRYSVLLGATRSEGVPLELFTSGEARWLGVQVENEPEQPRVLLVSVPYALKAADAETLGGRPASAFLLAPTEGEAGVNRGQAGSTNAASGSAQQVITRLSALAGTGNQNFLAKWTDNAGTLGNSMIYDDGTFVGIGTSSPAWPLDLVGNFQMQSSIEPFFRLNNTAYSAFDVLSGGGGTAVYNNALTFFRRTGSGTAKVIFDPSVGNVGIGTNTPEALLTVGPGAALALGHQSDVTRPYLGFGTYWDGANLRAEGGSYLSLSLRAARSATVAANTLALGLYDGSGIVSDNLLLIKGDRSFGINDGTVANGAVSIRAAGTNQDITLTPSGTGNTILNGNIGIGTPTPSQKLSVAGIVESLSGGFKFPDGTTQATAGGGGGSGTVTSVGSGTGLTGGPITTSGTLSLDTSYTDGRYAQLGAANDFTGNQTVTGRISASTTTGASIFGTSSSSTGYGVYASNTATTGNAYGVYGISNSSTGSGLFGSGHYGVRGMSTTSDGLGVYGTSNSSTGNGVYGSNSATTGAAYGVYGLSASTSGIAVQGSGFFGVRGTSSGSGGYGVYGSSNSSTGYGLYGYNGATSGDAYGVYGLSQSTSGMGVRGLGFYGVQGTSSASGGFGVFGTSNSSTGYGLYGYNSATSGDAYGVYGTSNSSTGYGVFGTGHYGVRGGSTTSNGYGVYGYNSASSGDWAVGVYGGSNSSSGRGVHGGGFYGVYGSGTYGVYGYGSAYGVYGNGSYGGYGVYGDGTYGVYGIGEYGVHGRGSYGVWGVTVTAGGYGVYGSGGGVGYAGYFSGNVHVTGTLTKGSGSFKIDHPLEPETKFLSHSFVESPDMMNIYNGVVTLNGRGEAWISLPEWFEALNREFRYQLTAMGAPQPRLYVAREISGNRFQIAGGRAGGRVSWQVTGIRQDAYARAHRIAVEEDKPAAERGYYLHPEVFGQPKEKGIEYARNPELMREREKNAAQAPTASSGGR